MMFESNHRPFTTAPRPAAKDLIVINVVVFVLQHLLGWFVIRYSDGSISPLGALSLETLRQGKYLSMVTYLFVHQGLWHLVGNMLMVYFAGKLLEGTGATNARFYRIYFFAGIGAGLLELLIGAMNGRAYSLIGASGAAFGVALAAVAARPWQRITALIYFVLPVNMYLRTLGKVLILSSLILGLVQFFGLYNMGIAHFAHLGGGIIGFLMAKAMGLGAAPATPPPMPSDPTPFSDLDFDPFSRYRSRSSDPLVIDVESQIVGNQDRESAILHQYGCQSVQDFMVRVFEPIQRKKTYFGEDSLNAEERRALEDARWILSKYGDT